MLDLNEVPDQPFLEAAVKDCAKAASSQAPSCSPLSVVTNDIAEEISLSSQSFPLPSSFPKEDGQNPSVEEAASVVENPLSKCPTPSSLSVVENPLSKCPTPSSLSVVDNSLSKRPTPSSLSSEVASTKQFDDNSNSCSAPRQATPAEGAVDNANGNEALGLCLRTEPLHPICNSPDKTDSFNANSKAAFHCFVVSLEDASTSPQQERSACATAVHEDNNARAGTILSTNNEFDPIGASEISSLSLSLGGIFGNKSFAKRSDSGNQNNYTSDAKQSYASSLCKPETLALLPSKSPEVSSFWRGKLCARDSSMKTPVAGYCLGVMPSDSRLKRLPSALVPKKYLKLEELEKIVLKGVAEPLMQIKPTCEASSEEIGYFSSWVKMLSMGWESSRSPSFLSSVARKQGLLPDDQSTSSAALMSWDGDSVDAKLCLVSLPSMQAVLKSCKPSSFVDAIGDIDLLDPESLYGVFCHSTSGAIKRTHDFSLQVEKVRKTTFFKHSEIGTEGTLVSTERARDILLANLSRKEHLTVRSEVSSKGASLQRSRNSGRGDCKLGSGGAVRGVERRNEKQLPSSDRAREATGKHYSRNSAMSKYEEDDKAYRGIEQGHMKHRDNLGDSAIQSFRQECRSDRLKDSHRRSKDDKDYSKQRAREHCRHRNEEMDKPSRLHGTGEHHRDQDKIHSKEMDRLIKESVLGGCRLTSTEKNISGSKNKSSLSHRTSPDHESGRLSRKRDREDEKEKVVSGKRQRELSVINDLKQLTMDLSGELKPHGRVVKHIHYQSPEMENGSAKGLSSPKPCNVLQTLDTLRGTFDANVSVMDVDAQILDTSSAILDNERGTVDNALDLSQEPCKNAVSLVGVRSAIPLRLFWDSGELAEDRAPSDFLGDPLLEKRNVEKCSSSLEFILDVSDKETRTWLLSKQSISYLEEEYGVHAILTSDLTNIDVDEKIDPHTAPIIVRISGNVSVPCDMAEDKWFLEQASATVKSIASRGVFSKCFWYEGPVQIHPGDGAPSVPIIVKKIKGEDGKNLEKIQDSTGVMIGVVQRKRGGGPSQEMELLSCPRIIGLRLKCVRRKGLLDASKEVEALLESVADFFSKELATHIATHIVDLQAPALHPSENISNQSSPLVPGVATRELLPNLPVKEEASVCLHKANVATVSSSVLRIDGKILLPDPDGNLSIFPGAASRSLYVTNLPDHITPVEIRNILENVLRQKLQPCTDFDYISDLVVDVTYEPDRSCALVLLVNDALLNALIDLYEEDTTVFQGMKIELGPVERQGSITRNGIRSKDSTNGLHDKTTSSLKREEERYSRRQGAADNDYDSDCSEEKWLAENLTIRADSYPGRPRPLFLSELMRNASAPVIKQLFEDIITRYIGPNLIGAGGRQLVLDVRYVPSRGCAFVDLAFPELVEFMLDLHSRRPDVFMNMKMELGRKPVPYAVEEDSGGRLNLRLHGKSHFSSQTIGYRLSLASCKKTEKRSNESFDLEDSDKGDDLQWSSSRLKKQRSDPEKTIYVDRLPDNASEGTIKKIFERVLLQKVGREELEAVGGDLITEVRHIPSKYCAFVVFATEDLTRTVLQLYNQDEEIFESMRLKPHFHSRMEDLYKDELQEIDEIIHTASLRERMGSLDSDNSRLRQLDLQDSRARSAAHRAITASAFREVDRRRSVYVDRIPEDLSESTMTEMFEKIFRFKKHGHDGHMVSQVAYFRDKFDPSKLCAFVEVKTESGTQGLVDYYNANPDAFRGMRVRPGFKYHS